MKVKKEKVEEKQRELGEIFGWNQNNEQVNRNETTNEEIEEKPAKVLNRAVSCNNDNDSIEIIELDDELNEPSKVKFSISTEESEPKTLECSDEQH